MSAHAGTAAGWAATLRREVVEQRRRIDALRGGMDGSPPDLAVALSEVETAHEELRVAEEELAHQQEQIDALVLRLEHDRVWRERLCSRLPVPVLVTDGEGVVVEANSAACSLLGVLLHRLLRKPLAALVAPEDRGRWRTALSPSGMRTPERQVDLRLRRRGVATVPVRLIGVAETAADQGAQVRWFVFSAEEFGARTGWHTVLARALSELAALPAGRDPDLPVLLAAACPVVRRAVPAATGVSITVGDPASPSARATDDSLAQAADGAELAAGEGPSLDAWRLGASVRTPDAAHDPRWTRLRHPARDVGLGAVVAVPLLWEREVVGTLAVHAAADGVLGEDDVEPVELLAATVAAAVVDVQEREALAELSRQLRTALGSRAVIDQAKGIIMAGAGCDADSAFRRLSRASQRHNVKLRHLAALLVEDPRRIDGLE